MTQSHATTDCFGAAAQPRPLLSICIPTYNRASYLPETLESLLPQLAPDAELLVYDTGSTDGTPDLMRDFSRRFPEIRFFSLDTRRGFDEALLLLLEQARGEYVWYFGSDDVLKEGAIEAIRRHIVDSPTRPSLVFLNHEIVDNEGRLLISSNVGRKEDREFRDGRKSAAWLGLYLGYISACIFRRDPAPSFADARQFDGSLWMGMYLNLWSLAKGGPALYVGRPMVRARRNPGNTYNYGEIFCRRASQIFWNARRHGIGWFTIYRAMNRTVRLFYWRFSVARRCDDPAELDRAFPAMLRTCWMYPWFWLLIVPVRLTPSRITRRARNYLRARRQRCNDNQHSRRPANGVPQIPRVPKGATPARGIFRALLNARKLVAALSADRVLKAVPFLVSCYRGLYARLRPEEMIRTQFRGHTLHLDPGDLEVARTILTVGAYEWFETDAFIRGLAESMVVVDAGANIGHYTLEAARRVGAAGKVFAFEPEPHNFSLLCQNIEANGYRNVTPVQKALSNRSGMARLALSPANSGGHRIETSRDTGKRVDVETITLDEYFRGASQKVDVVKMDTQGAEMPILEGMAGLLSANPDLILFTEFWPEGIRAAGYEPEKFLHVLGTAGFHVGIFNQEKARIEALADGHREAFVQSLLREDHGQYFADLLCLRGKAVRGPLGPHTWFRDPLLTQAAYVAHGRGAKSGRRRTNGAGAFRIQ